MHEIHKALAATINKELEIDTAEQVIEWLYVKDMLTSAKPRFVKIYNDEVMGEIVVMRTTVDGQPRLSFIVETPLMGVLEHVISYEKSAKGLAGSIAAFRNVTRHEAILFANRVFGEHFVGRN